MKELSIIFGKYGPWGYLLIVMTYILLESQFTLKYPRDARGPEINALDRDSRMTRN